MPGKSQAAEARRLAEEQRNLRDELARANEQMNKQPPLPGKNPLEELIKEEDLIVQGADELAKLLSEKPEVKEAKEVKETKEFKEARGGDGGRQRNQRLPEEWRSCPGQGIRPADRPGKLDQLGKERWMKRRASEHSDLARGKKK